MLKVRRFDSKEKIIHTLDSKHPWIFTCSMISGCEPLFNSCYDNHGVASKLKRAGVINSECHEDSESSLMFVCFETKENGEAFVERLNNYLKEKARRLKEASDF